MHRTFSRGPLGALALGIVGAVACSTTGRSPMSPAKPGIASSAQATQQAPAATSARRIAAPEPEPEIVDIVDDPAVVTTTAPPPTPPSAVWRDPQFACQPTSVAAGDSHLFFTCSVGEVRRVEKMGGAHETLWRGQPGVALITARGPLVVFAEQRFGPGSFDIPPAGAIFSLPAGGGPFTVIVPHVNGPLALALDDRGVVWAGGDAVKRAPFGGGGMERTIARASGALSFATTHGGEILWTDQPLIPQGGTATRLRVASSLGDDARTIARVRAALGTFVADAQGAYFADRQSQRIVAIMRDGKVRMLARTQGSPLALAADETHVYWVEDGIAGAGRNLWGIARVKKSGGPTSYVMTTEAPVEHMSLDARNVYFTYSGTETGIARAPK